MNIICWWNCEVKICSLSAQTTHIAAPSEFLPTEADDTSVPEERHYGQKILSPRIEARLLKSKRKRSDHVGDLPKTIASVPYISALSSPVASNDFDIGDLPL
ncbi:hypothetical protein Dimus_006408 [Dionaea muscipula]